ncbi:serine hydrolase domain-containing protein [Maricaulis sp.]|uniref:serine hydrolase domain-containing protein n=1 Tax=Maricaulis sp. TaxID=1486257 RepID=UPI002633D06A|nr:serine hydrolase domain-containing protein [Maricaulis sp.]
MFSRLLLVPILACLSTITAHAERSEFRSETVDRYIGEQIRTGTVPGAAIAIVHRGELVHAAGYGQTEPGGEPVTPEHTFRSASTLKMMVGMALVRLHDEGRLDLHAPISRYLHGLDPAIGALTTHELLNHTSGLLDTSVEHSTPRTMPLLDYARSLDSRFIYVSPGASFSYSNPGYAVAGAVLEAATGLSFEQAMRELLLAPLHMDSSTFSLTEAQRTGLAVGHRLTDSGMQAVAPSETGLAAMPSGTMFSTVLDYANFLTAFIDNGQFQGRAVWRPSAAEIMQSPQIPPAELVTSYSYSYGLMNGQFFGQTALFHTGGMPGYASNVLILPELDLGVVLFTNGEELDRREVLRRIVAEFTDLPEQTQNPAPSGLAPLSPAAAAELFGIYEQRDDLPTIRIFQAGEEVLLRNRGVDYVLHHEGDEFYIGVAENGRWFRFRIAVTPDGKYRFVQWWIRSFARRI